MKVGIKINKQSDVSLDIDKATGFYVYSPFGFENNYNQQWKLKYSNIVVEFLQG